MYKTLHFYAVQAFTQDLSLAALTKQNVTHILVMYVKQGLWLLTTCSLHYTHIDFWHTHFLMPVKIGKIR